MKRCVLLLVVLLCTYVDAYNLIAHYTGNNFFNAFNFFDDYDPSSGYVNYVSEPTAKQDGLIGVNSDSSVYIGCDHKNTAVGLGRNSVRLESKQTWNRGLFVMDVTHIPTGCGTWPAWWLYGPNWPQGGEIDMVEGVNHNTFDTTTLHTSEGCWSGGNTSLFSGTPAGDGTDCYYGCGVITSEGTFGEPFNEGGSGGVFVAEWTENYIQNFFFTRDNIPADLLDDYPDPSGWDIPYAYFELGNACPDSHFHDMTMVVDIDFCGDWAGALFGTDCPGFVSCQDYVQSHPSNFSEAYWNINYIKVYSNSTYPNNQSSASTLNLPILLCVLSFFIVLTLGLFI